MPPKRNGSPQNKARERWAAELAQQQEKASKAVEEAKAEVIDPAEVNRRLTVPAWEEEPEVAAAIVKARVQRDILTGKSPQAMRVKTALDLRRTLMACISEDEILATKDQLVKIALSARKDSVKAIALLWQYVMGPGGDTNQVGTAREEMDAETKKQKILSVVGKDAIFKDPEFRRQLSAALLEGGDDSDTD